MMEIRPLWSWKNNSVRSLVYTMVEASVNGFSRVCALNLRMHSSCFQLTSVRSLLPIAPPVNSLNIIRMIVSPSSSHAPRTDVVWDNVAIVSELGTTEDTLAVLRHDLAVE